MEHPKDAKQKAEKSFVYQNNVTRKPIMKRSFSNNLVPFTK